MNDLKSMNLAELSGLTALQGRQSLQQGVQQNVQPSADTPQCPATPATIAVPASAAPSAASNCLSCGGAGWLRMDVPVSDPRFGKLLPCPCRAVAQAERKKEALYRTSNLQAFNEKTFAGFDLTVPGAGEAFAAATDYATQPYGWLLLVGGTGTGKTHLAAAIANYALQKHGMEVYFAVTPELLQHLRTAYAPSSEIGYDELFEQVRSAQLLVIDDLGAEKSTPWVIEKLYQIFNYRYNYRLPTVVTTNCDMDGLDPRVRSRLCDPDLCCHVFMACVDYRVNRARRGRDQGPVRGP